MCKLLPEGHIYPSRKLLLCHHVLPTALNMSGIHLLKHFYVFSSLCSYLNLLGRDGSGRVASDRVTGRVGSDRVTGRVGSGKIGFGTTLQIITRSSSMMSVFACFNGVTCDAANVPSPYPRLLRCHETNYGNTTLKNFSATM